MKTWKLGEMPMPSSDTIKDLFSLGRPLGPLAAEEPDNLERLTALFDGENEIVRKLSHRQNLIVGRKGSGKTTLLGSVLLSHPDTKACYLPSDDVFSTIVTEINGLSDSVAFVEQVGRLWEFVLWGIAINYVFLTYKEEKLRGFCTDLDITQTFDSPYLIIQSMLAAIKKFPPDDWPLPTKISYKQIGGISFLQAQRICSDVLTKNRNGVYILLDSLEEYHFDYPKHCFAISGLLRCLGTFNSGARKPVELRCCVPAEKYHEFIGISSNPIKDFQEMLLVHWKAGELIQLAAKRYARFLESYYAEFYNASVKRLDLDSREDLQDFWDMIFPPTIENRLKVREKSMAYILRHTQLLPRHLLLYLNNIIAESIKNDNKAFAIDEKYVRDGVFTAEHLVRDQILRAYEAPGRDLRRICQEVLSGLNSTFTWNEFHGIAARIPRGIPGAADRTELMAVLTEIGAIGRLVGENERYVTGVFEYMQPHRLVASPQDRFCVHPVFTVLYNVNTTYSGAKPVYTYWSGITDGELAQWM